MKQLQYTFLALIFALGIVPTEARTIRDLWIDMPDSLSAYLDKTIRTKLIDLAAMDTTVYTENKMKGLSRIDSIADDYLSVKMSDAHRLEIKTMVSPKGDSCMVVLSTYMAGRMHETTVLLYDYNWNEIGKCQLQPEICKNTADIDIDEEQNIVATVAARFDEGDYLVLQPCVFPKDASPIFTQNKVKINDLIFK